MENSESNNDVNPFSGFKISVLYIIAYICLGLFAIGFLFCFINSLGDGSGCSEASNNIFSIEIILIFIQLNLISFIWIILFLKQPYSNKRLHLFLSFPFLFPLSYILFLLKSIFFGQYFKFYSIRYWERLFSDPAISFIFLLVVINVLLWIFYFNDIFKLKYTEEEGIDKKEVNEENVIRNEGSSHNSRIIIKILLILLILLILSKK
jgi:hypothetical protein